MAIIMAVARERFAVVAADTLVVGVNFDKGEERTIGFRRKILAHSSVPLLVAMSGVGASRRGNLHQHLRDVVTHFDRGSLTVDKISRVIRARLHPFIHKARLEAPPEWTEQIRCTVFAAWVRDGKANILKMHLTDRSQIWTPEADLLLGEHHRSVHECGPYSDLSKLYGMHITDPLPLAAHCRSVISYYIAADKELHGGENRRIGGEVDVAIVDVRGARLVNP